MGASISMRPARPAATPQAEEPGERAAHLVAHLPLADGLRVCLSLADRDSLSFELAALRWHSAFCSRASDITLREAQQALIALGRLPGPDRNAAVEELLHLSLRYHQYETVEILHHSFGASVGADP